MGMDAKDQAAMDAGVRYGIQMLTQLPPEVKGDKLGQGVTLQLGGLALMDLSEKSPKKALKIARDALASAKPLKARARCRTLVASSWVPSKALPTCKTRLASNSSKTNSNSKTNGNIKRNEKFRKRNYKV